MNLSESSPLRDTGCFVGMAFCVAVVLGAAARLSVVVIGDEA